MTAQLAAFDHIKDAIRAVQSLALSRLSKSDGVELRTEAQLYHYAKPMLRRTVELECFLRWQLLQSTDTILDLA